MIAEPADGGQRQKSRQAVGAAIRAATPGIGQTNGRRRQTASAPSS